MYASYDIVMIMIVLNLPLSKLNRGHKTLFEKAKKNMILIIDIETVAAIYNVFYTA